MNGLKTLGIMDLLRRNPSKMCTLLVKKIPRRRNTDIMLLDVFQPKLSPEGSNIRHLEDAAMVFWANFLQLVESKNSFLSLLF